MIQALHGARRSRPAENGIAGAAVALFTSGLVACAVLRKGRVAHATPTLEAMIGRGVERRARFVDCVAPDEREAIRDALDTVSAGKPRVLRCRVSGPGDRWVPVELRVTGATLADGPAVLVAVTDLTERLGTERLLQEAARTDALTELPNRVLLQERLTAGLATASRHRHLLGLLVADLDGFKAINDRHGHAAGDTVLREVARRFAACVRCEDTLARVGGDEFVVVLPEIERREDAAVLAARLVNALRTPVPVGEATVVVGVSAGIAIFPDDGADIDTLFARADAAMYASKHAGRNQFAYADVSAGAILVPDRCRWSSRWRVGVASMDEEHETLFRMLAALGETARGTHDAERVRAQVQALVTFAEAHFASEERAMEAARFRGLDTHRAEHRRLLGELGELAGHTHRVGAALTTRFLRDWLIGHMQGYDRAAARAILAARGARPAAKPRA
jgi:diguanylate cyclase (GGDEF)-like protein/hemerythrin-like metal-binding protein